MASGGGEWENHTHPFVFALLVEKLLPPTWLLGSGRVWMLDRRQRYNTESRPSESERPLSPKAIGAGHVHLCYQGQQFIQGRPGPGPRGGSEHVNKSQTPLPSVLLHQRSPTKHTGDFTGSVDAHSNDFEPC